MTKKDLIKKLQKAVGRCPICGRLPTWFNNIPLEAYCWGTSKKPHMEWSKIIPGKAQPYKEK
jgi:hypothetical protein